MKLLLPRLRLLTFATFLWVIPTDARAVISQPTLGQSVDLFYEPKTSAKEQIQNQGLGYVVRSPKKRGHETQSGEAKQAESDFLLNVRGELAEGDGQLNDESLYDLHTFEGQASQIVRITLTSEEFDTFLLLQNSAGEELTRNDDGREGSNAEIVYRLPVAGQYRIVANSYNSNGKGSYRLIAEIVDEQFLNLLEMKAEADRLLRQGTEAAQLSQYHAALEAWQTALELYRELGERHGEAASLGSLGIAYFKLGEYQRAIDLYQQSLVIAREIGERFLEASSLGNLGSAYDSLGDYQRAISFHEQSLAIKREIGSRQGIANSLGNLGDVYDSMGEHQRAISLHRQQLAITREINDQLGEANSLGSLGTSHNNLGDYQSAISFHEQALAIRREIGDRQGESASLSDLSVVYDNLGDYQRALDLQQQSLAITREISDR